MLRRVTRCASLLFVLLAACGGGKERPNLVLVTIDTIRADHLGCYGYFRETSPEIDAFAKGCVFFERCYTPISITLPSHTSILSGTYPEEHGIRTHVGAEGKLHVWPKGLVSYAERMKESRYATAAFVSGGPLKRVTGIDRGFDRFDQPAGRERSAEETNAAAFAWLDSTGGGPFFLWIHYFDPHGPHHAPPPFAGTFHEDAALESYLGEREFTMERRVPENRRRTAFATGPTADLVDRYDDEVLYTDHHFSRLLDRLRRSPAWGRTVVLLVGDHGQGLGQHGLFEHGSTWGEQLHVPCMIRLPDRPPERVREAISTVDLLPTLLGLCPDLPRLPPGFSVGGRNVLAPEAAPRPVFGEATVTSPRSPLIGTDEAENYTLTTAHWKYFLYHASDHEALYDLSDDPYELCDVAGEYPDTVAHLREELLRSLDAMRARAAQIRPEGEGETREVSPEHLEDLRALGYVD